MEEAPQALWAPFPLTELVLLAGIVLVIVGFVTESCRGTFLAGGFGLVTLGGLELALREHFAGFRSHSGLLAAASAIVACVPLFFLTELPQELLLVAGAAVGVGAFVLLRRAFAARAGGLTFRV